MFIGRSSVTVVPAPTWLFTETRPPIRSMVARTTSMPTPRPETSETSAAVEKPAAKTRSIDLLIGQRGQFVAGSSPSRAALLPDRSPDRCRGHRPMTSTMSRSATSRRPQSERRGVGFARRAALLRRLDAMIQRVAHEVHQRLEHQVDNGLVGFGRFPVRHERDVLAELLRQVAHDARKRSEHLRHRHHSQLQNGAVNLAGESLQRHPSAPSWRARDHDRPLRLLPALRGAQTPCFATSSSPARSTSASILASSTRSERPAALATACPGSGPRPSASVRDGSCGTASELATSSIAAEQWSRIRADRSQPLPARSTMSTKSSRPQCAQRSDRCAHCRASTAATNLQQLPDARRTCACSSMMIAASAFESSQLRTRPATQRPGICGNCENADLIRHKPEHARQVRLRRRTDALQAQIAGKRIDARQAAAAIHAPRRLRPEVRAPDAQAPADRRHRKSSLRAAR